MAQKNFLIDINLLQNQLSNARIQNLATPPASPKVGQIYFDTSDGYLKVWDGSSWVRLGEPYTHPAYTAISDSSTVNATGAEIITHVDWNIASNTTGHLTAGDINVTKRTLSLSDLGYTGPTDADKYFDWNLLVDGTKKYDVTSGASVDLIGGGAISLAYASSGKVTISHTDTSTQSNATNTGANIFSGITLDTYGHITGINQRAITPADIGAIPATTTLFSLDGDTGSTEGVKIGDTITMSGSNGISTSVASGVNYSVSHSTASGYKHIPSGGSTGDYLKWNASGTAVWASVPGGLTLGESSSTAYRGDRGKIAYDHSQAPHAPVDADNYGGWRLYVGSASKATIGSNGIVNFVGAGGIATAYSSTNNTVTLTGRPITDSCSTTSSTTAASATAVKTACSNAANAQAKANAALIRNGSVAERTMSNSILMGASTTATNQIKNLSDPSIDTDAANKRYVDDTVGDAISGTGKFMGPYNANTNSPVLIGTSSVEVKNGDIYEVTTAGDRCGVHLEIGDTVISTVATTQPAGTVLDCDDWILVQKNLDQATTTTFGIVRLATDAEVCAGESTPNIDAAVITPESLDACISARSYASTKAIAVPAGATSGTLNTAPVNASTATVSFIDRSNGETYEFNYTVTNNSTISLISLVDIPTGITAVVVGATI